MPKIKVNRNSLVKPGRILVILTHGDCTYNWHRLAQEDWSMACFLFFYTQVFLACVRPRSVTQDRAASAALPATVCIQISFTYV